MDSQASSPRPTHSCVCAWSLLLLHCPCPCCINNPAGAYTCASVPEDCGTGPGKPCCPYTTHIATNPPTKRRGCPDKMFCNYDFALEASSTANDVDMRAAFALGTCQPNAPDCGQFSKSCCITTGGSTTTMQCGAKWNEPGPRGYCADPFDNSGSNGSNGSSGGGSRSSSGIARKATYKELVCTACPAKPTEDMLQHPTKYWPC